ncbi:hypothetical protein GE061_016957 [Apolygus lucorum]|uniref:Uncharacterized protein n=1 Tax=Apolygus lucorum TaxID=248454 RepID=A0A8S9XIR8_APOLU|nr:hypothetical protein GE061_016957 [Apolygus lucorum]
MVESVLLYAAEVWGIWCGEEVEVVQSAFLKSQLCLPRNTPGHYLRLECGRVRLGALIFSRALKYLAKILKMSSGRWTRVCLEELMRSDADGSNNDARYNWFTKIKSSLLAIGAADLLEDMTSDRLGAELNGLMQQYINHCWSLDIQRTYDSAFNPLYRRIVEFGGRQHYLGNHRNIHVERLLAQMRLASKDVTRFYHKRVAYTIDGTMPCMHCNMRAVENAIHWVLLCPLYEPYRRHYLLSYIKPRKPLGRMSTSELESVLCNILDVGEDSAKAFAVYNFVAQSLMLRAFSANE